MVTLGGPNSTAIQTCANDGCGFGNAVDANVIINAAGNLTGIGPLNAPQALAWGNISTRLLRRKGPQLALLRHGAMSDLKSLEQWSHRR
jgi:hypothetical protein